jgi:hypothetical protein
MIDPHQGAREAFFGLAQGGQGILHLRQWRGPRRAGRRKQGAQTAVQGMNEVIGVHDQSLAGLKPWRLIGLKTLEKAHFSGLFLF